MKRKDFEVMAPVGSYESLEAALQAGANSVYFGVEGLNMRSRSSANFTLDDLRNIVERCNAREVKTYLTVNTIILKAAFFVLRPVSVLKRGLACMFLEIAAKKRLVRER